MGKHAGLAVMREIFRALHGGMGEYIPAIARNLLNDPRAGQKLHPLFAMYGLIISRVILSRNRGALK